MTENKIVMYGNQWCPDCRRARILLEKLNIPFEYIDVEKDPTARRKVLEVNHGNCSVPTILFPDGTTLTEPDNHTLSEKLEQFLC